MICNAKNVENHANFFEEFWPEFYARGRFMKYSKSAAKMLKMRNKFDFQRNVC